MNIAVMLPNWIGDVVMATPALRALRSRFGDSARLIVVSRPHASQVLAGLTWFDEQVIYDRRASADCPGTRGVVRQLRKKQLDSIILLTNSLRTGIVGWLSGAKRRIGYRRYGRGLLLTEGLLPPRESGRLTPVSPVDYYLNLVERLDCDASDKRVELATTAEDEAAADEVWKRHSLSPSDRVIVLNSGGAYGAAKHWPAERFAELAARLVRDSQNRVLVICGPAERSTAEAIEQQAASPRVVSLARDKLSVGLSKACVRRSSLMITTDSGPRHFAAAFGVPSVALFGPTDPRWSRNYHAGEKVLQQSLPCVPCSRRTCPLGHHRCMTEMSVEQVYEAAMQQSNSPNIVNVA
jgi:heptosyltransferase-2